MQEKLILEMEAMDKIRKAQGEVNYNINLFDVFKYDLILIVRTRKTSISLHSLGPKSKSNFSLSL